MIATLKHTRATQKYEDYIFFSVSNFNISISTTCSPVRHSPQLSSSLPSEQSAELSHLQLWLIHFPSPHWNWDPGHPEEVCGCGRAEPHIFLVSSRPSAHHTVYVQVGRHQTAHRRRSQRCNSDRKPHHCYHCSRPRRYKGNVLVCSVCCCCRKIHPSYTTAYLRGVTVSISNNHIYRN